MMKDIHTIEQLKIALKSSETHARTCTVQDYNTQSNYWKQNEPGYLAISVSPKMVKKAVKVLEIFLTRLIRQGVSIDLGNRGSCGSPSSALVLEGHRFHIRIKEIFKRQEVKNSFLNAAHSKPTGQLKIEVYYGLHYRPAKTMTASNVEDWPDKATTLL